MKFLLIILFSMHCYGMDNGWDAFKEETILQMEGIPGWCSTEKSVLIMDCVREISDPLCVEIGVFCGKSMYPIIRTIQFTGKGSFVGIDAWSPLEAIKGFESEDANYLWWKELDYTVYHQYCEQLLKNMNLTDRCKLIKKCSSDSVDLFQDNSIDFIHFDGNHNLEFALQDVRSFLPKVKDQGFILLNDPNWYNMRMALVYLLERCDIVSPFNRKSQFLLLRKNEEKIQCSRALMIP